MEKQLVDNNVMSLKGVLLKELPENFRATGSLDLTGSLIEKLPDNTLIYDDLIIGDSKLEKLPSGLKIGGNLIMADKTLPIPADIVIGGNIINNGTIIEPPFKPDNMIFTTNNQRVSFRNKKIVYSENYITEDYFYPEVSYYFGINPNKSAIEFTEDGKTYIFSCSSPREGFEKIDWQRAENFGIHKYQDYNVDEFRTVEELKEIYQTCTGACESGIVKFKKLLNIDDNSLYTIRQLGDMVSKLDWVRGSVVIFFKFFNLKHPRFEKEAD